MSLSSNSMNSDDNGRLHCCLNGDSTGIVHHSSDFLTVGSLGSFPEELAQLLQKHEENDDAISPLTKPDRLKNELRPHNVNDINYPSFHETNHRITTRMERRFHGLVSDVPIHPLDEERAVQAAAFLLAELSIYTAAGTCVFFGVKSYISASKQRKERLRQELQAIKALLAELHTQQQNELHAPKEVGLAPNQVESKQMLDGAKELLRSALILDLLRTLLDQDGKSNSN